jgi:putative ABC transport system permease protein
MKLALWRRGQDRQLDEEIESHLRLEIADRVERGEPLDEAIRSARRQFGNVTIVKEVTRDMWGWTAIERVARDMRYALRSLRRTPVFTAVAIVTFALGIGANTAMFSVINAVMLRPLPFPEAERLVDIRSIDLRLAEGHRESSVSWPDFFDWRTRTRSFAHLSAYHETAFTISGNGRSLHMPGVVASADLFSTLGVQPAIGRQFAPDEEKSGADVAVISDGLWRSHFGGDPAIVGAVVSLNRRPFTIVGVMPPGFRFPIAVPAADVWVTTAEDARVDQPGDDPMTTQRGAHFLQVIGRLRPDVTLAAARAEMDAIAAALAREHPDNLGAVAVTSQHDRLVGDTRRPLVVLLVAVACVLLIACVNLANLLLARGATRVREIAMRLALGASRSRIVLQLLTEAVVLSALGAISGLFIAAWSIRALTAIAPVGVPGLDQVAIDGVVLAFTAVIAFASAIAFGIIPALIGSRTIAGYAAADSGRSTASREHGRIRSALVVAETALGVMLLIAAGLLVRSVYRLAHLDPGFDRSHVVTARFRLPDVRYGYAAQIAVFDRLLDELNAGAGVEAAAAAPLPIGTGRYGLSFDLPGAPAPAGRRPTADFALVSPRYFRALRIPLVSGRDFTRADDDAAPRVLIVNEAFARQYFPGQSAIGQRLRLGLRTTEREEPWRTIVGVVGDFRQRSLTEPMRPTFFIPYAQGLIAPPFVVIRTSGPTASAVETLRALLGKQDPELALYDVRTLDAYIDRSVASTRFQTLLLALFAALAVVLTAVGVYGVVAYGVAQRTREFGIRLALGARPRAVMALVLRHALSMAAAGVVAGVLGAGFATRLLGTSLYGVHPLDPPTFVGVPLTLFAVVAAAALVPARRATRVDPMLTLRSE